MSSVSVVIPCYNRAACIGRTLENVLGQSRAPDEVIVVDDGSTDDSAEVVRSFGERVRLIQQTNQGPGAARNRGLEASRGDYVWFMDSDDLASRNQLEAQFDGLESSGADLAYGPWIRSRIDDEGITFLGPVLQSEALPSYRSMLEWQLGSWCTVFQACLFRRDALDKAGRYRTDMKVAEDGEYLVRILAAGARPVFVPGSLLFYRSEGSDQLTNAEQSALRNAADLTCYFECIGTTLELRFGDFAPSTVRALALEVYRHNRFCSGAGIRGVGADNPAMELVSQIGTPALLFFDRCERMRRKLMRLGNILPASQGMRCQEAGQKERSLALESGRLPEIK